MRRIKIDLSNYGLIQEYTVPFGRWRLLVYLVPLAVMVYIVWFYYMRLHFMFNPDPDANTIIVTNLMPYFLLLVLFILLFLTLLMKPGRVITFQEGIYVDPGPRAARDPARLPTFLPWDELTQIVRTPHRTMRMSIVGREPTDEVILPDNLRRQFPEIQDQILHMQTRGKVEIIDLEDISNYSLAEYGSSLQDIFGLSWVIVLFLPLLRVFVSDIGFVRSHTGLASSNNAMFPLLLIPVISGLAVLIVIVAIIIFFRIGWFKTRMIVYRSGMLRLAHGMGVFTRWEELQSMEKVRPGIYKLHPVNERVKAYDINIGKAHDAEFERILRRLGKLG